MNIIRANFFRIIGIIYVASLLFVAHSCSVTECLGVICKQGTCINGTCNCDAGYEGKTCDTIIRNTFESIYNVSSSCLSVDGSTYPSEIIDVTSSNYTQVVIENMFNLRMNVTADINGTNDLTIPLQYDSENGYTWAIQGNGSLNSATKVITLHMIYTQTSNNINDTCTEAYTRKN